MQPIDDALAQKAYNHLLTHDRWLAPIIERTGPYTVRPHKDYYRELVESIISQQLSIKAADTILSRFIDLFGGTFPLPKQLESMSLDTMRSAGLSFAKARYIQDLASHILDGSVRFDHLDKLENKAVVQELTAVKGIGEWTAHMFLMFCMGRSDVLPVGDLGIRNGIQRVYAIDHLPSPDEIRAIAVEYQWHPYESIASWYIWKAIDNEPK